MAKGGVAHPMAGPVLLSLRLAHRPHCESKLEVGPGLSVNRGPGPGSSVVHKLHRAPAWRRCPPTTEAAEAGSGRPHTSHPFPTAAC